MSLAFTEVGAGPRVLVLLHGFTGNAGSFDHVVPALARGRRVVAVDLPGHGRSPPPPARGPDGFRWTVDALGALLDRWGPEPVELAGYSQGARLALAVALAGPGRIRRLVLESGTPGLRDPEARAARREVDEALARRIEAEGVEAFVDRWEALPLFAGLRRLPPEDRARLRARRLSASAAGLAAALRTLGQGVQPDLWPALPGLTAPTLLLAGTEDPKYARLAEQMASALPGATLRLFEDCGHAPHLERPDAWTAALLAFLDPQDVEDAT